MLLTYSKDRFVDAIKSGTKIHTLREDPKKRWKPGMSIQHWRGNPRNTKSKPYQFLVGQCKGVQEIRIERTDPCAAFMNGIALLIKDDSGGEWLMDHHLLRVVKNDGLTMEEFREWFVPESSPVWEGRIIHFTDLKY